MKDIKINIKEHIEFNSTNKERMELINFILTELTTWSDYEKFLKGEIKKLKEKEIEFQNDARLIESYNTIIKSKL
jgi:hypothetical protein